MTPPLTEYADFHRLVIAFALTAVRIGMAMELLPALSSSMVTGLARRAATLAFAALAVPMTLNQVPPYETLTTALLVPIVLKEAIVGLLIGFFAAVPFWIAENVGNFIDNQRGATMGEVYSPLNGSQVSTTGICFTQIVSTLFFVGGAVFIFLGALYKSYQLWPVFGSWGALSPATPTIALGALDGMLRTTVVIAAPVIILMFLATLGLGLVNRTAPQLNVFFLSMPVKSALGVAMLVIYVPFIMDMLMYTKDTPIIDPIRRMLGG